VPLFAIGLGLTVEGMRSNLARVCRARRREARVHAGARLRPVCGGGSQSALHDRCGCLCHRADCKDGVCPGRRVQGAGIAGRGHGLDHNALVCGDAAVLTLRSFSARGSRQVGPVSSPLSKAALLSLYGMFSVGDDKGFPARRLRHRGRCQWCFMQSHRM
jgi:hypothetical protein